MPVYLLHGFRWPRDLIRIHIILNNLDDAAAEWLTAPATTKCLHQNFRQLYPSVMAALPNLRFIEQYDPNDITSKSQPYAYVADTVHEVSLGIDIDEVRGRGVAPEAWSAITELRDKLCQGLNVKLAWYVVVCGDEERWAPPTPSSEESSSRLGVNSASSSAALSWRDRTSSQSTNMEGSEGRNSQVGQQSSRPRSKSISRGFKKMFSGKNLKKATSLRDLKQRPEGGDSSYSNYSNYEQPTSPPPPMPPPPLPGTAR